MTLRSSFPRTRRPIFWILFVLAIATPPSFILYVSLADTVPVWLDLTLLRIWLGSIMLLCIWCALCVRDEPGLVRCAMIGLAIIFLFLAIGFYVGPLSKII
jgi:hypothetical protein